MTTTWEAATGSRITALKLGRVDRFALTANDRHLVTTDVEFLRLWDLATGRELLRRALPNPSLTNWGATAVTAFGPVPRRPAGVHQHGERHGDGSAGTLRRRPAPYRLRRTTAPPR